MKISTGTVIESSVPGKAIATGIDNDGAAVTRVFDKGPSLVAITDASGLFIPDGLIVRVSENSLLPGDVLLCQPGKDNRGRILATVVRAKPQAKPAQQTEPKTRRTHLARAQIKPGKDMDKPAVGAIVTSDRQGTAIAVKRSTSGKWLVGKLYKDRTKKWVAVGDPEKLERPGLNCMCRGVPGTGECFSIVEIWRSKVSADIIPLPR